MNEISKDLDDLKFIIEFPRLYLANYFADLRNKVDTEFYRVDGVIQREDWLEIIETINEFEKNCLLNIKYKNLDHLFDANNEIICQVESALDKQKTNFDNETLNEIKESLEDERFKILKRLFGNKSIMVLDLKDFRLFTNNSIRLVVINDFFVEESSLLEHSKKPKIPINLSKLSYRILRLDIIVDKIKTKSLIAFINVNNSIKEYVISDKEIDSMDENVFEDMISLERIDIYNNYLKEIPKKAFNNLKNLKILDLNNNKITWIPHGLFFDLCSLEKLDISKNPIDSFEFYILDNLINLKELALTSSNVEDLGSFGFQNLKKLVNLKLDLKDLKIIHKNAFNGLESLKELSVNASNHLEIDESAFNGLANLESGFILGNDETGLYRFRYQNKQFLMMSLNLDFFSISLFECLSKIQTLKLSNVNIFEFRECRSICDQNLKCVFLEQCTVNEVKENIFDKLKNINEVILTKNSFDTISENMFSGQVNIKKLIFRQNSLKTLPSCIFRNLWSLEELDFSWNKSENTFDFAVLSEIKSLKKLNLWNVGFEMLKKIDFESLVNLEELDLSHNKVNSISELKLNGLINLNYLSLSHNQLEEISEKSFISLVNLKKLNLKFNQINESLVENLIPIVELDGDYSK